MRDILRLRGGSTLAAFRSLPAANAAERTVGYILNNSRRSLNLGKIEATMRRQTLSRATAAASIGVAVLVGGGKSYAADADDVRATIDAFHAALSTLDIAKADAVWAHDDCAMDKEPVDKAVTLGRQQTRKNFEGLFEATSALKVTQVDGPHIQVQGNVAWSMGVANAEQKLKNCQAYSGVKVFESDVFKKQDGRWLFVSHATSLLPQ
jgi:ketosteroid isomerase-like protein